LINESASILFLVVSTASVLLFIESGLTTFLMVVSFTAVLFFVESVPKNFLGSKVEFEFVK
jgi:hypothetical protein